MTRHVLDESTTGGGVVRAGRRCLIRIPAGMKVAEQIPKPTTKRANVATCSRSTCDVALLLLPADDRCVCGALWDNAVDRCQVDCSVVGAWWSLRLDLRDVATSVRELFRYAFTRAWT